MFDHFKNTIYIPLTISIKKLTQLDDNFMPISSINYNINSLENIKYTFSKYNLKENSSQKESKYFENKYTTIFKIPYSELISILNNNLIIFDKIENCEFFYCDSFISRLFMKKE